MRINLEGREPSGVVPPAEYEPLRDELIDLLSGVRTPDGEPVFSEVARREAFFEGPETENAVDIVTVPAGFDHFLSADLHGEQFGDPGQPWNHKREGLFAAAGEAVDAGVRGVHTWPPLPDGVDAAEYPTAAGLADRLVALPCHQQLPAETVAGLDDVVADKLGAAGRGAP